QPSGKLPAYATSPGAPPPARAASADKSFASESHPPRAKSYFAPHRSGAIGGQSRPVATLSHPRSPPAHAPSTAHPVEASPHETDTILPRRPRQRAATAGGERPARQEMEDRRRERTRRP